uniref:Proteasome subunit alpha type-2 n=1 Tax=Trieres chinensis TaxID=1514140 RepID=A0A7S1ZX62_TRICV|mmetsp:Transcript_34795/g.71070  ORF Transcript_34795/g.71070 Transcript_34795/m.71070 type:complete len:238 (+) Transcript_34795:206-919(+)|eukprot:CAMPEP_0183302416 /NCGR_PEP_ID=MMETSP0160_2-20130417/8199_1 /TAXON_ID=2839 ORGANISM="Odontella Sinensis, Strain Grunow 1884" /NCGR_SAMPLE_ID=MMETSP0160_2 /ASSEMBLY_ACC=CAM_ASM_000250 /LENGTH=237 /DNA_ID=CAMNT_0025465179 /DNA_START=144 /DNA_END=857 /DNA_ORIENTATION=+
MGDSAYSFSLTTFSRTGKLLQIEYALNAVANGRTSLGICARDGVVVATDKKFQSDLVDSDDVTKVERVNDGCGFVYSGVGPDYRVLVRKARKSAQSYFRVYREPQPVSQLVKSTASVMQEYTQSGGVRPFGVSLLVAGVDGDGTPRLYQVDPSGAYFGWKATAIGKNYVNAKNFLEKRYTDDMELEDAVHTALLTLREGFEGEMTSKNIEVGIVSKSDGKFRVLTADEVQDYLDEAN